MDTDGLKKFLSREKIDCHGYSGKRQLAGPREVCLTDRFLDRGAVTWPSVSERAFAGMGGIFEDFHWKQRGIGEEFPT